MVRIAIIRRADLGITDGVNRFIFNLADGLRKLNSDVTVFGHHVTNNPSELFDVDVEIRLVSESTCGGYLKYMWDWYFLGSKLLRKFEPKLLIVNGVVPLRLDAFKVVVNHGNAIFELRESRLKRFVTKRLYGLYDRVVCVSSKVASEMGDVGIKCDKIIPIPIILENYASSIEREPIVLHVGTSSRKNPEVSVKAIEILRDLGYDVKLILIGSYHKRNKNWLIVKDKCPDGELRNLYSKALALMLPSMWEGLPYVALEAQASGTPVIVGPGVPDEALVKGKSGFKLENFNPKEYAEKIRILLDDKSLWIAMSKEARKYAENFDHIRIAKRYLDLIMG